MPINSASFADYTINYSTLSADYLYMTVGAVSPASSSTTDIVQTILIRKITITEVLPPLTFTLSPSPVNKICGTTLNQTFTVTSNIPPSATVSYLWNLGSSSNGWLYNGSPASATIATTTNTLALTAADCGTTPNNITVTATVNGTNYNAGTITVNGVVPSFNIGGAGSICSGSESYNIGTLPCSATVMWTASPSGIVSITSSGNSASLTKIGNGTITLTATISNVCGGSSIVKTKTIIVGSPTITTNGTVAIYYNPGDENPVCRNQGTTFDLNYSGANSVTWSYVSNQGNPQPSWSQTSTDGVYVEFFNPRQTTLILHVDASNTCGTSGYDIGFVAVDCAGFMAMTISPNPTTGDVQIEPTGTEKTTTIKEIEVVDKFGNVKKKIKFNTDSKKCKINIAELAADVYFIRVYDGKAWTSKKIIKN